MNLITANLMKYFSDKYYFPCIAKFAEECSCGGSTWKTYSESAKWPSIVSWNCGRPKCTQVSPIDYDR